MSATRAGAVAPLLSPAASKKEPVTVQPPPKTSKTLMNPRPSTALKTPKSSSPAALLTSPKAPASVLTSPTSRTPGAPSPASPTAASPSDPPLTSPVFKLSRAKKLFTLWDLNHDHFLSPAEFSAGLTAFVATASASDLQLDLDAAHVTQDEGGKVTLSSGQVDALWKEADVDGDGRVSLAEFQWRFAEGPDPRGSQVKRRTAPLQQLKRVVKDATKMSVEDLRAILDAVYDGPNPRFKAVDLSKTEQLSNAVLKRILTQCLQAEKEQAAAQKRPMEDWAQHCWGLGGLTQKDCDRLFASLDSKKSGRIDLGPVFALAQQKPGRAKGKKKAKANPDYLLTTVKEDDLRDFVTEQVFAHLQAEQAALKAQGLPHVEYRCHPPLAHWGDDDVAAKGLALRGDSGYKKTLLLSERTRVRGVRQVAGGWAVYAVVRAEMTELKRVETAWHVRLDMKETEEVRRVVAAVKKGWRDGEVDVHHKGDVVDGWSEHCSGQDEEELSIPPIV